jgi:4-hydroxy-3-polyprenylbenzoate decarboxylase
MRVVVAMTGASGAAYGVHMLQLLQDNPLVETHLVVSHAAALTLDQECDLRVADVARLADHVHKASAIGASIASGSFAIDAMLVVPCSVKTLSAIAYCHADDLITRAADVRLKEGQPLLLMVRETPLHLGHLRAMTAATEAGAIIMPPVPAMYARPESIGDIVDHTVRRALHRVKVPVEGPREWQGLTPTGLHAGRRADTSAVTSR